MSHGPLEGRAALVVGAGRGIGAAAAGALARAGARTIVAARTAHEVEQVAAWLRAEGLQAWPATCDVTVEESVARLAEEAHARVGAVDILVNSAGDSSSAPLPKLTLEEWQRMFAVHATGTFLTCRAFAPAMVERGWGRIVNVASRAGLTGAKYVSHYSAAKHAMIGFTRSVALELAGTGVTIHAVCPGYVDTPMTARTLANVEQRTGLSAERALAAVLATTGQERLVTPAEVAEAILELCREDAGDRNGETVLVPLSSGKAP